MLKVFVLLAALIAVEAVAPHGHGHEEKDYYVEPHYSYEYEVKDPHTGDYKTHKEVRNGKHTEGVYSLHEPDGSQRTVQYLVEGKSGFVAKLHRETKHSYGGNHGGYGGYGSGGNGGHGGYGGSSNGGHGGYSGGEASSHASFELSHGGKGLGSGSLSHGFGQGQVLGGGYGHQLGVSNGGSPHSYYQFGNSGEGLKSEVESLYGGFKQTGGSLGSGVNHFHNSGGVGAGLGGANKFSGFAQFSEGSGFKSSGSQSGRYNVGQGKLSGYAGLYHRGAGNTRPQNNGYGQVGGSQASFYSSPLHYGKYSLGFNLQEQTGHGGQQGLGFQGLQQSGHRLELSGYQGLQQSGNGLGQSGLNGHQSGLGQGQYVFHGLQQSAHGLSGSGVYGLHGGPGLVLSGYQGLQQSGHGLVGSGFHGLQQSTPVLGYGHQLSAFNGHQQSGAVLGYGAQLSGFNGHQQSGSFGLGQSGSYGHGQSGFGQQGSRGHGDARSYAYFKQLPNSGKGPSPAYAHKAHNHEY